MPILTIQKVMQITGGRAIPAPLTASQAEKIVRGVATDSRTLVAGDCFIALPGDTFDGHQFVAEAVRKGAAMAIVARQPDLPPGLPNIPLVQIASTQEALEKLARFYRREFSPVYVAITGSLGKTTSKEMTYQLISNARKAIKSPKSFNNNIGVPLTLLQLQSEHQVAVLELGTNHFGEIAHLSDIVRPDIGVITCVAPTHLEGFGSVEGVERAKAELLQGMDAHSIFITNGDDDACLRIACRHPGKVVTFGCGPDAELRAEEISGDDSSISFTCAGARCHVPVPGRHNVYNVLVAMGIAKEIGMAWPDIVAGLLRLELPPARMEIKKTAGITWIGDCYNASPRAVMAAIDFLRDCEGKRKIAVLGSMLELGDKTAALHYQVGQHLAQRHIDLLYTAGEETGDLVRGAREHGMPAANIKHCADSAELHSLLTSIFRPGDVVLFKASHKMQFENLLAQLLRQTSGGK